MKTDDLIALLATQAPPVQRGARRWTIAAMLAVGALTSLVVMMTWLRINPSLLQFSGSPWFWVRFCFIVSVTVLAWGLFVRLGKPGVAARVSMWWLALPVAVMALLGAALLLQAPEEARLAMILGVSWNVCARNIAILAIPIFAISIWVAREFAPTRLRVTGAMLGFFSGALSALIYSLHCPELAPSFLMIWYVLGIAIPGVVGALLGRRLLGW